MRWLEGLIDRPHVNNVIQDLAGRRACHARIAPWLAQLTGRVLDVGAGTGRIAPLLPNSAHYISLDPDGRRHPAVVGQAERLPFATASIEAALMVGMAHHLREGELVETLAGLRRVLVPRGTVILLEPVLAERRLSRVLWARDRGGCPRQARDLYWTFREAFRVQDVLQFTVLHQYLALRARNVSGQ